MYIVAVNSQVILVTAVFLIIFSSHLLFMSFYRIWNKAVSHSCSLAYLRGAEQSVCWVDVVFHDGGGPLSSSGDVDVIILDNSNHYN